METIEFLHLFSEYYLQVNKVKSLCSRHQKFFVFCLFFCLFVVYMIYIIGSIIFKFWEFFFLLDPQKLLLEPQALMKQPARYR